MSTLRGRRRDTSWQWLLVGVVLGMGCASVFCLAAYAANLLQFNIPGQQAPTPTVQVMVITATLPPATETPNAPPTTAEPVVQPTQAPSPVGTAAPVATLFMVQATQPGQVNNPTPVGTPIPFSLQTTQNAGTNPLGGQPTVNVTLSIGETATPNGQLEPSPLISITGGEFQMGTTPEEINRAFQDCTDRDKGTGCNLSLFEDALPAHTVTVDTFAIEQYEVSHQQFVAFLNQLGQNSHVRGCGGQPCAAIQGQGVGASNPNSYIKYDNTRYSVALDFYNDRPAIYVTWYGAKAYCESIQRRLLTEAEWEYAARGGAEGNLYPWGPAWDETRALTSRPTVKGGPDPITSFPTGVTTTGIYNMAGNVAEWVSDWYDPKYYSTVAQQGVAINPQGPTSGQLKVHRGGSWDALPLFARTVHRGDLEPNKGYGAVGFRCAASGEGSALQPPVQSGLPAQPTATPGALSSGTGGN